MTQSTIQIYGRVRPLKKNSKVKNDAGRYWITRDNSLNSKPLPTIGFHVPKDEMQGIINHQKENHEFSFNEIFDVDATQDEIFDVVAKPVVDRWLGVIRVIN
jgi:kinesin family protein 6/9